jgi:site-specific recombinase XerD
MSTQVCILSDGRRIKFSIKRRKRDPFYLVKFRGPDGRPRERSTKEAGQRRAVESAIRIIQEEYEPEVVTAQITWEEAIEKLKEGLEGKNLRWATVHDYCCTVHTLRDMFRKAVGPGEITPEMAERYKIKRLKQGHSASTVESNLRTLSIVYRKWWIKTAKLLTENPFAEVEPPKVDRKPPRILLPAEVQEFFDWLSSRWDNWRLPLLFLEVKGLLGCRINELASAASDGLRDGRIRFEAQTAKGRKQRIVKLPPAIYAELQRLAGGRFVFEKFSE